MYQEKIKELRTALERTIEYFRSELTSLQVGRATPGLVEEIEIDAYGQKMKLKELAAISVPEPRLLIIRPWDKEIMTNIEAGIRNSNLKLSPVPEEDLIRLKVPPLSEERRKELAKILQEKAEECHISIRRQREEAWKEIQLAEQKKEIREDDKFRAKDELQKIVDEYNGKIGEMKKKKEQEIMAV